MNNTSIKEKRTTRAKYFEYGQNTLGGISIPIAVISNVCELLSRRSDDYDEWTYCQETMFLLHGTYLMTMVIVVARFLITYTYHFISIVTDRKDDLEGKVLDDGDLNNSTILLEMIANHKTMTILCIFFSDTICKEIFPLIKYAASVLGMIVLSLGIRMKGVDMSTVGLKFTFIAAVTYALCILAVAATLMNFVWSSGRVYLHNMRVKQMSSGSTGKDARIEREVNSLLLTGVTIGGLYHMEKEAKLTLIRFLVDGAMNMLLLMKSK